MPSFGNMAEHACYTSSAAPLIPSWTLACNYFLWMSCCPVVRTKVIERKPLCLYVNSFLYLYCPSRGRSGVTFSTFPCICACIRVEAFLTGLPSTSRFHVTHTHTCLAALYPGLPRWASTRMVKPIWILLKQETVSGSGISWATCKSAPRSRQTTTPAPHHSVFAGRMPFLPPYQQWQSTEVFI